MGKFVLRKMERLSRESWIGKLFEKGFSFQMYPLRVVFMPHPDPAAVAHQIMFSVSRRLFRRAVDRNKIKRRVRDAYRLNKASLDMPEKWLIAYIYVAKEVLPSPAIHHKVKASLERIREGDYEKK